MVLSQLGLITVSFSSIGSFFVALSVYIDSLKMYTVVILNIATQPQQFRYALQNPKWRNNEIRGNKRTLRKLIKTEMVISFARTSTSKRQKIPSQS